MSQFLSFRRGAFLLLFMAVTATAHAQFTVPLTLRPPDVTPTPAPMLSDTPAPNRFVPAKLLQRVPVGYPVLARLNRVEGVARVQFSIDETGSVTRVIAIRSGASIMLDTVVTDSNLRSWKFQPATFDGKPVPSTKEQEFEFRLDPAEERAIALKRLALPVGTPDAPYPKEALASKPRGNATVQVKWSKEGLVDMISLVKPSGNNVLDVAALRWAYENWHIDPATLNDKNKNEPFSKTMNFAPPP